MEQELKLDMGAAAEVLARREAAIGGIRLGTFWHIECHDRDGKLKWVDEFHNLVVDAGLDDSLDKHLKGSTYTAAWYVGLLSGTPTVDHADTMSGGHAGWTEVTAYDEANRQTLTLGTVSGQSVDNSASPAVFTISTDSTTIG